MEEEKKRTGSVTFALGENDHGVLAAKDSNRRSVVDASSPKASAATCVATENVVGALKQREKMLNYREELHTINRADYIIEQEREVIAAMRERLEKKKEERRQRAAMLRAEALGTAAAPASAPSE